VAIIAVAPSIRAADRDDEPLEDAVGLEPGATCLDERRLESHVQFWLGSDRVERGVRVFVRGDANRASSVGFRIERRGKVRERRFDAVPTECEESHAVVALAIALAIDAEARRPLSALEAVEPSRAPLSTLQFSVAHAVLAGTTFGGKLGLELTLLDWLSVRGDFLGQFSTSDGVDGTRGKFTATLLAGAASACGGGPVVDGLRVAVCTGLAAGGVTAQGSGFSVSRGSTAFLFDALAGLRTEFRAGIPWVVDLEIFAPIKGVSFRVDREGSTSVVRQPEPLGVMLSVGGGIDL